MHPARRNKVDISVCSMLCSRLCRTHYWDPVFWLEIDSWRAEHISEVRKTSYQQESLVENAEGALSRCLGAVQLTCDLKGPQIFWFWRLCPLKSWSDTSEHGRNCNSQPREVSFLLRGLSSWWDVEWLLSIPHASPGVSIGHQIPSISPTSTSPVNRESGLSQMNIEFSEAEAEEGDQEDVKDKMTEPKPSTSEAAAGTTTRRIQEVRMETQEINDINTTV